MKCFMKDFVKKETRLKWIIPCDDRIQLALNKVEKHHKHIIDNSWILIEKTN